MTSLPTILSSRCAGLFQDEAVVDLGIFGGAHVDNNAS